MSTSLSSSDDSQLDIYMSSPEPTMCDCQNQLGHFDWNGVPHENLPDLCRRTMGMRAEYMPKNDEILTPGSDVPDTDPDTEWEQVILRRASRNRLKDLGGENVEDTDREIVTDGQVVDKGNAGDLTHTKGTWTRKNKKGVDFRFKFRAGKKRSMVKISVKIT